MVGIDLVRASNAALKQSRESFTAVFVGGTSGIGMGTLKQFVQTVDVPKVYVIGRSRQAAQPLLDELNASNPQAKLIFLETQITLMRNVDAVCKQIKENEKKIDLLFLSPGYLTFEGRNDTSEGIDLSQALRYYARLRFVHNLLPHLKASHLARVVAILSGGLEKELDFDDLEMKKNFSPFGAATNGGTQTSLIFEELAKSNPEVTFIHKYPGFVATGVLDHLMSTASGIWAIPATLARYTLVPLLSLFANSKDLAGERGLFISTSDRYPPANARSSSGVALPSGLQVARASVVEDGHGNGVYLLDQNDESSPDAAVMPKYRAEGKTKVVLDSTLDVWNRALSGA